MSEQAECQPPSEEEGGDLDPASQAVESQAAALADLDSERKWFAQLAKFVGDRTIEPDHSGRVQFAYDQMYIACCERLERYFRSDLPANKG